MKKLQTTLDTQIGKGNIHNLVVAVQSYDREIDLAGAAGIANPQTGIAMTPDTPYFLASITKMYTATIILRLYEEKRLDLNAYISDYLPDALTRAIHVYKGVDYSDQIRVSNLIDHSSGLADYETDKQRSGKSVLDELKSGQDRAIDLAEAIEMARNLPPHFPPGARGKAYYSNTNYRLLGAIIEAITEKSMATNFKEMICMPLGLADTYLFDWTAPRQGEPPATIYLKGKPINAPQYLSSNVSDGGLVSTASESVKFLRAFFEGQLFDKNLFDRMMNWKSIFFPLRYGYGLMYFHLPGTPEFIGHAGSTGSFAFTCPSQSVYLAGTVNQIASPAKPFFLMSRLVRDLR